MPVTVLVIYSVTNSYGVLVLIPVCVVAFGVKILCQWLLLSAAYGRCVGVYNSAEVESMSRVKRFDMIKSRVV